MKKTVLLCSMMVAGVMPAFCDHELQPTQTGKDTNLLRGYYNAEGRRTGVEIREPAGDRAATHANMNDTMSIEKISRGSELIGTKVKNSAGETLGVIKDLAIDNASGRISYAVLSSGGFLGFRDKEFAVPLKSFTKSTEERVLLLNADKALLTSTPGLIKNHWPAEADAAFIRDISTTRAGIREPAGARIDVKRDPSAKVEINRNPSLRIETNGAPAVNVEVKK